MTDGQIIFLSQLSGNIYFIKSESGFIMVDTGMPGSRKRILKKMNNAGIDPQKINLIIITHAHQDHIGNLNYFKTISNAKILVHNADAEYVAAGKNAPMKPNTAFAKFFTKLTGNPKIEAVIPDIEIADNYSLSKFGIEGKIYHTPGHTAGSISIMVNGELIVGDLVMAGFIFQNRPGLPFVLQDKSLVVRSIQKILKLHPAKIHVGHGGPFTMDAVRKILEVNQ